MLDKDTVRTPAHSVIVESMCGELRQPDSNMYWVIHKELSVLWQVIVSVTARKKIHMNKCVILNGYRDRIL